MQAGGDEWTLSSKALLEVKRTKLNTYQSAQTLHREIGP